MRSGPYRIPTASRSARFRPARRCQATPLSDGKSTGGAARSSTPPRYPATIQAARRTARAAAPTERRHAAGPGWSSTRRLVDHRRSGSQSTATGPRRPSGRDAGAAPDEVERRRLDRDLHRHARRERERLDGRARHERRERHAAVHPDAPERPQRRHAHDRARSDGSGRWWARRRARGASVRSSGRQPTRTRSPGRATPATISRAAPTSTSRSPSVAARTRPGRRFSTPTNRATASSAGAPKTCSGRADLREPSLQEDGDAVAEPERLGAIVGDQDGRRPRRARAAARGRRAAPRVSARPARRRARRGTGPPAGRRRRGRGSSAGPRRPTAGRRTGRPARRSPGARASLARGGRPRRAPPRAGGRRGARCRAPSPGRGAAPGRRRPSGAATRAARPRTAGAAPWRRTVPRAGRVRSASTRRSVDFPAPFGPITVSTSPGQDLERRHVEDDLSVVADLDALDRQDGRRTGTPALRRGPSTWSAPRCIETCHSRSRAMSRIS